MATVLMLGGCVSGGSDDRGINDPLPRMSEPDAQEWVVHWTESMARTARAEIDPESRRVDFSPCVGGNDEVVNDGRFHLRYSVRADIAPERRADAVRDIRDALLERGLEIEGYRSDPTLYPANALGARHPRDQQWVTVEDNGENQLLLIVHTPCLLPPGVEQQEL
ncbi:hypothetical protein [Streptomyces marincola]|uniref:hypothetical protein n=1 Tax=Streptomyces marincola TaxID=2878388 RepID=UPI00131E00BD|nr:hypothetical protein [Streptomyces marincola]